MTTRTVHSASGAYDVVVEWGGLASLGPRVRQVASNPRALIVADANVAATHGVKAMQSLRKAGCHVAMIDVAATERSKSLRTVRAIYDALLTHRMERGSPVIALGGGIVGDAAGFAAATYLRGVPLIHAPTSLLAMVDASIGGKTGVNINLPPPGGLGKNLVGAFWPPRLVLCDPAVLRTLPPRELRCGLAECIKHALIADAHHLDQIERDLAPLLRLKREPLERLITASVDIKAAIVERDERESGERAFLNLGHTFAHAIESLPRCPFKHGEAVAIGLMGACAVSAATDRLAPDVHARVGTLLDRAGLPRTLHRGAKVEPLLHAMRFDKKVSGGRVRLVLLQAIGRPAIADDVPVKVVADAWRGLGAA